jgi:hypothetical protein
MKFVATKTADQLDLQALHRVRERLVSQRTGIINQICAFMLERGIAVRQGIRFLRAELPIILSPTDVLSPRMLRVIEDLASDWRRLDERIETLSREIETIARQDAGCDRLMSVPRVGDQHQDGRPLASSFSGCAVSALPTSKPVPAVRSRTNLLISDCHPYGALQCDVSSTCGFLSI